MTRLKRITNKIFGNTASTTGSSDTGPEIGQFGSAKAGTYNATADVETIQALPAYEQGWIGAVIPDQQYPTLPEMTGVNKVLSYQTGYLMQEGIPEWDSGTTYYKNSIVKYAKVTTTQTTTVSIGASTGITSASVNKNTFVSQISVDGNYTFTYNGTSWLYNDIATDLNIYGITYTGTPAENDTITVTLTTTTSIGDLTLYISLTDDNINHNPLTDTTYWKEFGLGGGSGLEICDIGMALYVDETKGLRRYLNGQIVDINTNTQAFLDRLKEITTLHPSLLCTEEEWQSAKTMSAFGQVGKFVFNYSGGEVVSVRIPRVVNVQGLFDLQNLGMTVSESLPNIIGKTTGNSALETRPEPTGAFYRGNVKEAISAYASVTSNFPTLFSASKSSSTYQDNAPVQQEAIQYPYFIQIATGSETENNIINDIELNNPYSLFECKYADHELFNLSWLVSNGSYNGSNAVHPSAYQALLVENNAEVAIGSTVTLPNGTKYTKQGLSVKLSTETYTDYDFVINPADETFRPPIKPRNLNNTRYLIEKGEQDGVNYRIYSDGYCEQWGAKVPSQASWKEISLIKTYRDTNYLVLTSCNGNVNGTSNWTTVTNGQAYTTSSIKILGVTADASWLIAWKTSGYLAEGEYTPLTDNILLYYYVGETVQNANLIDAGRIGEQLASLITIVETYQNGASWYRVYSDGWCEQGGMVTTTSKTATVTFLKPFINLFYTPQVTCAWSSQATGQNEGIEERTTSSMTITVSTVGVIVWWSTSGYIR